MKHARGKPTDLRQTSNVYITLYKLLRCRFLNVTLKNKNVKWNYERTHSYCETVCSLVFAQWLMKLIVHERMAMVFCLSCSLTARQTNFQVIIVWTNQISSFWRELEIFDNCQLFPRSLDCRKHRKFLGFFLDWLSKAIKLFGFCV